MSNTIESKMTLYVLGFAFGIECEDVLLIEKKRPKWQAGLLNGLGGHIDEGETVSHAMVREFKEESAIETKQEDWELFAVMQGADWRVYCLKAFEIPIQSFEQHTDEMPVIMPIDHITGRTSEQSISNVPWLVQAALDPSNDFMLSITYK